MENFNYNLWDFDLEGYKEMVTQTNLEGGFASGFGSSFNTEQE